MKKFVYWAGVYYVAAGIFLFFPGLMRLLGIQNLPMSVAWNELTGIMVIFFGVALVLCSRDLKNRGSIVYWMGFSCLLGFLHLGWFGFFGGMGFMLGVFGLIDLLIGLGFIMGLPKALQTTHGKLFMDAA